MSAALSTLPAPAEPSIRQQVADLRAKFDKAQRDLALARERLTEEPSSFRVSRACEVYTRLADKAAGDVEHYGEQLAALLLQVPCFSCGAACSDDEERRTLKFGGETRYFCGAGCKREHDSNYVDSNDDGSW